MARHRGGCVQLRKTVVSIPIHLLDDAVAVSGLTTAAVMQQSSTSIAETIIGTAIALSAVVLTLTARLRAYSQDQKADREARKLTDDAHTQALCELLRRTPEPPPIP
jgi:uncharacterized membrane protein